MKFVVEALGLVSGGGRTGLPYLLKALAKHGRHEYVALLTDLPECAALKLPNLRVVLRPKCRNLVLREWRLNVSLPKLCREERADALLCLGSFVPHYPPVPTAVFLHNPYCVYRDAFAYRGFTLRDWLILKYGWHQFRHLDGNVSVVVQSEVMKARLISRFPIPSSRVFVIPDRGASPGGLAGSCPNSRVDEGGPFTFLCVAVYSPNKNLEVLVEAVKRLRSLARRPFQCLLTINPDQHPAARKLLSKIENEKAGDILVNIGFQPPDRLVAFYKSAGAFISPTLLESFGRPYVEAMQFGLPILTSDRDFAHERCRNAAVYFDPLDAASVARAMATVMEDFALRQMLTENGRRILAQAPTWDEIAARFVEVLERTAQGELAKHSEPESQLKNNYALVP